MSTVINVIVNAINSTVSPNPVPVIDEDTLLNFVLDQNSIIAGYKFKSDNAIVIISPIIPGDPQFVGSWTASSGMQATMVDLNTDDESYDYGIDVIEPASSDSGLPALMVRRLELIDPTIENNT